MVMRKRRRVENGMSTVLDPRRDKDFFRDHPPKPRRVNPCDAVAKELRESAQEAFDSKEPWKVITAD